MSGNKDSPEIPIYGNKGIFVRRGNIDIHGVPRLKTWSQLDSTIIPGATTLTVTDNIDWNVGEFIAIAPTGFFNNETEKV